MVQPPADEDVDLMVGDIQELATVMGERRNITDNYCTAISLEFTNQSND
jgi:hypothetical protein